MVKKYFLFYHKQENKHFVVDVPGHVYASGNIGKEAIEDYICQGLPLEEVEI